MRKTKLSKLISFLLCLTMVVTTFIAMPVVASAQDSGSKVGQIGDVYKGTYVYQEANLDSAKAQLSGFLVTDGIYKFEILEEIEVDGQTWYKYDCKGLSLVSNYPYVKAEDVLLPTVLSGTEAGIEVNVSGNIPKGVTLSLGTVTADDYDFEQMGITDLETLITALDIKLYKADGVTEWQPVEPVTVELDAASLGMSDGLEYQVIHDHNGEIQKMDKSVVNNGKVSFETDKFSVFAVTGLWGVADTAYGQTITMYVGEKIYFKCDTSHTHRWYVGDSNVLSIVGSYSKPDGSESANSYVLIEATSTGETVLYCQNNDTNSRVTITVIEKPTDDKVVKIVDQIYTNGCLIAELEEPDEGAKYKWYRNDNLAGTGDYIEVTGESIDASHAPENGVNVAVDQGGKCWYKVEVYTAEGELIATAEPYWVPYSNVLENGSFETPNITGYNPFAIWGAGNVQFNQNDTRYVTTAENVLNGTALWWKTTGLGEYNNAPGRDIEIVRPGNATLDGKYYVTPADGNQYAELNCEAVGTLYQDVLTAPNTTLKWSFSHLGRNNVDTMAVVVMPATVADYWAAELSSASSATAINNLLDQIAEIEGAQVWKNLTADEEDNDNTPNWTAHSGTYETVDGQYLSRFFFVSVASGSNSLTEGNLIDGVSFDDNLSYTIRYYIDGVLQESDTETGSVKPYTTISASNTANYSNYALKEIVKAANNIEDRTWGSTSMKVDANDMYLDLHYTKTGISVIKKVELTDTQGMTEAELEVAKSDIYSKYGTATFNLKKGNDIVATATVSVNSETGEGVAIFKDKNGDYKPSINTQYTIVETSSHDVYGYEWTHKDVVVNTEQNYSTSATYTNSYKKNIANLTITKSGFDPLDHDEVVKGAIESAEESQSAIFQITGPNGYSQKVVIHGNSSVTIENLIIGEYTVTELTGWSWRYNAVDASQKKTLVPSTEGTNVVEFENVRDKNPYWLNGGAYKINNFTVNKVSE